MEWQMGAAGMWMKTLGRRLRHDLRLRPKGWPSATEGDGALGTCERSGDRCGRLFQTIGSGPCYAAGSSLPTRSMK